MTNEKTIKAAAKYLENQKGYEMLEYNYSYDTSNIELIAIDSDDNLVFITVVEADAQFPKDEDIQLSRDAFEALAINYLADNADDLPDGIPFRYDTVVIVPLEGTKAALRHHINALQPAA